MLKKQLYRLWFSEKEVEIYLSLYRIWQASASTLARLTSIKRASVYDILNSLIQRNLVSTFKQWSVAWFAIDDVNKILHEEKEKLLIAENVVQAIKAIEHHWEWAQINYYKWAEWYREMYDEILDHKPTEMLVWINLDKHYWLLEPIKEKEWIQKRVKYNGFVRLITIKSQKSLDLQSRDSKECRETRFFKWDNLFNSACMIYNDFICLFDAESQIWIRVHNKNLHSMHKFIFETSWVAAKR